MSDHIDVEWSAPDRDIIKDMQDAREEMFNAPVFPEPIKVVFMGIDHHKADMIMAVRNQLGLACQIVIVEDPEYQPSFYPPMKIEKLEIPIPEVLFIPKPYKKKVYKSKKERRKL